MNWLVLILSLPTENATTRMRAWRALKILGAAVLRDGVYLLPEQGGIDDALALVVQDVQGNGGMAYLLTCRQDKEDFVPLFDRGDEYGRLLAEVDALRQQVNTAEGKALDHHLRQTRKLRKQYGALAAIDYFPGAAQSQVDAALTALEAAIVRQQSPDEPLSVPGEIVLLSVDRYQGRLWATRERPWVDRLASAWLIRRFIDTSARFVWLKSPIKCPARALGFDFDGADFSHVGGRVTFEVLLVSFGLDQHPALQRMGQLVHYLDVGGVQPAEALGVESVLKGLQEALTDDDALLTASTAVFEGLLATFSKEST